MFLLRLKHYLKHAFMVRVYFTKSLIGDFNDCFVFGVLSLVWMFIGYFSLFDLGLGRATTKLVAEKIDLLNSSGRINNTLLNK